MKRADFRTVTRVLPACELPAGVPGSTAWAPNTHANHRYHLGA
jgi:hypothetical protein